MEKHLVLSSGRVHDPAYFIHREPTLLFVRQLRQVWIPSHFRPVQLPQMPVANCSEVFPQIENGFWFQTLRCEGSYPVVYRASANVLKSRFTKERANVLLESQGRDKPRTVMEHGQPFRFPLIRNFVESDHRL